MTARWPGEQDDAEAAALAAAELRKLRENRQGEEIVLGNEFAEIRVCRVETRNGSRLLVEAPKSGQWVALCPLELEALTWQNAATFSAMIGTPFGPLFGHAEEDA
ncbi:hypothetical protein DI005_02735 [Prauserella sp. PE36]|uniref:Dihydrodiol dehydrogenase n=1 Tax=Prauserella endophytica TaxID=1592324 RepID=A0ABY2S1X4_9PSEU|nr:MULTISPECIES: hypothetical protein [Prauserella]RBM23433.1 hypothetical protein DI005_02735 [Prauserella sp. PE36]TKG69237.1 hypothetical protein FCN18_20840 [Prauserella endophytica]